MGYLFERSNQPDYRFPQVDAGFFDYWARGLATGDWSVPLNFCDYPDPQIQSTPYFRPPGYPYFLAGVYRLCGTGPLGVRLVQMGLGCLNIVLAFFLGRRLFDQKVGLVLALLMSVTWTFIYFEGELLATTLTVTLVLGLWATLARWTEGLSRRKGLFAGFVLGLLAITRANVLLFGPIALLWLEWIGRRQHASRRQILETGLGFITATAMVIAPITLRNLWIGHDRVLISSNAGINLNLGNNENSNGGYALLPDIEELGLAHEVTCFDYPLVVQGVEALTGREMRHSQVSAFFARKAWTYACQNLGRTLQLLAIKAALFWGPNEVSNNKNLSLAKTHSQTLRFLPGFPFALSLGILGILLIFANRKGICHDIQSLSVPQTETVTIIAFFVLVYFISYLPFFVAGRFRVPIIPGLLLLGAWAIVQSGRMLLNHLKWRTAMGGLTLWGGLYGLGHLSLTPYASDNVQWHLQRATCYRLGGDSLNALKECRSVVTEQPNSEKGHRRLADLLMHEHQYNEAIRHYNLADQLKPDQIMVYINLALAHTQLGQPQPAIAYLNQALVLDPNLALGHQRLANLYRQQGKIEQATQHYYRSVELSPDNPLLREDLARLLLSQRQPDAAIAQLHPLVTGARHCPTSHNLLGIAWKSKGQFDKAIEHYQKALQIKPDYPQAHNNLANTFVQLHRWTEAIKHYRQALALNPDYTEAKINLNRVLKITSSEQQP